MSRHLSAIIELWRKCQKIRYYITIKVTRFIGWEGTEALECYNKAFKIDPDCQVSWVYTNMGSVLDRNGKHEEAIEYYSKALILFDKMVDIPSGIALNYKGESLYGLGRYEEALECYNKALEINPNYMIAQDNKEAVIEKLTRSKEGR